MVNYSHKNRLRQKKITCNKILVAYVPESSEREALGYDEEGKSGLLHYYNKIPLIDEVWQLVNDRSYFTD